MAGRYVSELINLWIESTVAVRIGFDSSSSKRGHREMRKGCGQESIPGQDERRHEMTASRISDTLLVGDWQDAQGWDDSPLMDIVTVAYDSPLIGNFKFELVDGPAHGNEKVFWRAVEKVCELQGKNRRTLVHCVSGISRSCAVVIGYLMRTRSMDYNAALSVVRSVRPIANPQPYFVELLGRERLL